jgi:hypothetical protein
MRTLISIFVGFVSFSALAADIEWSGLYRIEGVSIHEPDLTTRSRDTGYGLQHLILRPKIVASDGFTLKSQFEVFNSDAYPNTHIGQVFGDNVRGTNEGISGSKDASNVFSGNGKAGTIKVSQLYLTWDHEYGSLVVGRVPLQFGLGMTYSAGNGLFDHFYDAMDLIGYKVVFGNLFVLPMIGKLSSGQLNRNDAVTAYMIQAQYDSPENDLEMGVFYQLKHTGDQGSDAPLVDSAGVPIIGGANSTNTSGVGIQTINVFVQRNTPTFRFGIEGSFQGGQTGVRTAGGDRVTINGLGIATEFEWKPLESNWNFGLKAGMATGDDPTSDDKFEGYTFNQNYDVAFLLFNHPLGQYDVFRTRIVGGGGGVPGTPTEINQVDIDTISNVFYFAPYVTYRLSDKWNMKGVLATGLLQVDPIANQPVSKDVGFELDYSMSYTPRKGVMWVNEIGLLFPGGAFKGSPQDSYGNAFTYGFQTKAAISF